MKLSIIQDPYYFGVYANMAHHNVFLVLHDIAEKARLSNGEALHKNKEENFFKKDKTILLPPALAVLNEGKKRIAQKKVIELLHEHFPFLQALNKTLDVENANPKTYYSVFEKLLYNLEQIRNFYTHAHHNDINLKPEVFDWMKWIFDDGLRKAKERFGWDENEIADLRREKGIDKNKNKPKANPAFRHVFTKDGITLTEKGMAFYLCLFLEKEYTYKFLKRLYHFDDVHTLEVYSIYRILMPRLKFKSDNNKEALLLDMLNELERCPQELYSTLKEDDKKKFVTRESESHDVPDSILLRKQNRFPYFALRYMEYTGLLENTDIHIDLGKYVFHSYKKTDSDQETYLRRWEKPIHVFGKLKDITNNYPDILEKVKTDPSAITDDTAVPYLVETNPHYHFDGKNIGLKIKKDEPLIAPFRKRKAPKADTEIEVPLNRQADIILCTDELQGLLFYDMLAKEYKKDINAEKLILNYKEKADRLINDVKDNIVSRLSLPTITNQYTENGIGAGKMGSIDFENEFKERKKQFAELLRPYQLEPHMIPEKIGRYLMGITSVSMQDKAEIILNDLKEETQNMLQILQPKVDKNGCEVNNKKVLRRQARIQHLKAGDRATFLAKDMMHFQPHNDTEGKDAPNSDEYRRLQAALAFFSRDRQFINRVFIECRLKGSDNPHPFLDKIDLDKCKTNLDFYKRYLEQRAVFIDKCIIKNLQKPNYANNLHFLNLKTQADDNDTIKKLAENILRQPINLPRGLFKDATIKLIHEHGDANMKQVIADGDKRHNTVYLLRKYTELSDDGNQPFYNWERNYRIVDEWYDKRTEKQLMQALTRQYKTPGELSVLATEIKKSKNEKNDVPFIKTYEDRVIENEKNIRHICSTDQMLFLMCKTLISDHTMDNSLTESLQEAFRLKDILPDNPDSILNKRIDYNLPKAGKKIHDEIKIKDFGNFRRFIKDRRLNELLEYFNEEIVERNVLRRELDIYENKRTEVFNAIYDFEIACGRSEQFAKFIEKQKGDRGYVEHSALLEELSKIRLDKETMNNLKLIRNAFAHNQFPDSKEIKLPITEGIGFTEQIADYAIDVYNNYTSMIQNELLIEGL